MDQLSSPLPLAGGVGGGHFQPRDTSRARELRNRPSPAERRLWRALSRGQVNGFRFNRQMPIGPYFADFLCRAAKLIVEIDGFSHESRQDYDQLRDSYIVEQGYAVLRFSNEDVIANLEGVARAIGVALAERCPPPTPPASGRGVRGAALFPFRLREGPGVGSCTIAQGSTVIRADGSVG